MFLNHEQILDRLQRGDLVIDPPPEQNEIGPFSVDLRLGTEFAQPKRIHFGTTADETSPLDMATLFDNISAELGGNFWVQPGDWYVAVTLQFLKIPADLITFLDQRASLARLGVMLHTPMIHPNYQGKIAFEIANLGRNPVIIRPGMRTLSAAFAEVEPSKTSQAKPYSSKYHVDVSSPFDELEKPELEKLKKFMLERESSLQSKRAGSHAKIRQLLNRALSIEGKEKGKALELLVRELFRTIDGLKVLGVNSRLRAEELDLVIQNDLTIGFWRFAGSPILVECKNWSKRVGASEIAAIFDKLQSLGPDAKTAVLVAPSGITGNRRNDALLKIREKRQQGRYIIVLDREALELIANGTPASTIIERKFAELWLI